MFNLINNALVTVHISSRSAQHSSHWTWDGMKLQRQMHCSMCCSIGRTTPSCSTWSSATTRLFTAMAADQVRWLAMWKCAMAAISAQSAMC